MVNLFICFTPLQALIAREIIHNNQIEADLLMVCENNTDNPKFRYYYNQTAQFYRRTDYVVVPRRPLYRFTALSRLLKQLDSGYHTVYVANIFSLLVQYCLSHLSYQRLETFDDGAANLYPDNVLYHNAVTNWKRRLLKRLHGIRYQTQDLRRLSACHHTLYPGLPNITEPVRPLKLWHGSQNLPPTTHSQRIWLGQPLFSDKKENIRLTEKSMQYFEIKYYFPHPREHYRVQADYIDTPLIFEDWLSQRIEQQPETCFEIYHLASTAALNTAAFPHTRIHAVRPEYPFFQQPAYEHLYALMTKMGIPIHTLPADAAE